VFIEGEGNMAKKGLKRRVKKRIVKKRIARKRVVKKRVIKKTVVKKRAVKKRTPRRAVVKKSKEKIFGVVTHYFPQVRAAAIRLNAPLELGDSIRIKGHTTDFTQVVNSLQINREPITKAKRGQEIGLLVNSRVRRKDIVYRV
jgi:putative protease